LFGTDDAGGEGDEPGGGEAILLAGGIGRGRRDQKAFGQAAPAVLVGDTDEVVRFEGAEVVVDLPAGNAEASGESGGGENLISRMSRR